MKKRWLLLILAGALLHANTLFAEDSIPAAQKTEERLAKLEKIISKLPRISGFINLRYQYSDEGDGKSSFDIRRARIDFQGDLSKKFDYRLQVEFAGTPKLLDAYIRWKICPYFNVQAGQMKLPLTFENQIGGSALETVDNSMAISGLVGLSDVSGLSCSGFDIGVCGYGSFFKKEGYNLIDYRLGVYNGNGLNTLDNNKKKDFSGMIWINPIKHLSIAGFHYNGAYTRNDVEISRMRVGGGVRYDDSRWLARSEYIFGKTGGMRSEGVYALVGYTFWGKFQPVLKYDYYQRDKSVKESRRQDYIVGFNYSPIKHVKAQVNYTFREIRGAKDANMVGVQLFGIF